MLQDIASQPEEPSVDQQETQPERSSMDQQEGLPFNVAISDDGDIDREYIPDMTHEEEEEEDEIMVTEKRRRKKAALPHQRKKWSLEEEQELKELFKEDFESLKLPGQKRIERMMKVGCGNKGLIYQRKRDTIKKKLSNMMIKIRRN